jgi:hypothetical protein
MASRVWNGGTTALDLAGNWSGGVVPGDGDSAFFPKSGYTNAPSTNMDGLANTIALIHVEEGAPYDIGSDVDPLQVQCTKWVHRGAGKLWMDFDSDVESDLFVRCSPGGSINVAGTVTTGNLHLMGGLVTLAGGLTITNDYIEVGEDATVTIGVLTNTVDDLTMWGGNVTLTKGIGGVGHIHGGRLYLTIAADTFAKLIVTNALVAHQAASTLTNITLGRGAILESSGSGQTVTKIYRFPGSIWHRDKDVLTAGADHNFGGSDG